jgi:cell wall-associated NlpC family hydrolase
MFVRKPPQTFPSLLLALIIGMSITPLAQADDEAASPAAAQETIVQPTGVPEATSQESKTLLQRASSSVEETLDSALDLIGIRYKRGGSSPEKGFDCSGFVSHVFREGLGLYLPHSAKAMSKSGETIAKNDLKPGDLVFFNTMRHAFSHVGIYLGDNLFLHSPRTGGRVRIEDMSERYWTKRFNGARRVAQI